MNASIVPSVNGAIDDRDCGYYLIWPFVFSGIAGGTSAGERFNIAGNDGSRRSVHGNSGQRLNVAGNDGGRRIIHGET